MTVITRETRETRVRVEIGAGSGEGTIETSVRFLDHMLATFARYAGLELSVTARGDLPHWDVCPRERILELADRRQAVVQDPCNEDRVRTSFDERIANVIGAPGATRGDDRHGHRVGYRASQREIEAESRSILIDAR